MTLKFGGTSVNLSKVGFLVADPSELYRHLFRRLLFGFGARKVHEAATVRDARLMLAKHHVDFLICAADLPGNGIEFTRSLRLAADNPQRTIPIIITMGTARRIVLKNKRHLPAYGMTFEDSIAAIDRAKRMGYALRDPGLVPGTKAMSLAFGRERGGASAALTVAAIARRMQPARIIEIVGHLKTYAGRILAEA